MCDLVTGVQTCALPISNRARLSVETRLTHIMKVVRARAAASPAAEGLGGIAVAVVIYIGGSSSTLTLGTLTAFIYAALSAYQPLKSLANLKHALQDRKSVV